MLETIKKDLIQARKDKDIPKKNILTMVRANITNLAIEQRKTEQELTSFQVLEVIMKERDEQEDSLKTFLAAGREDLANQAKEYVEILNQYLPNKMDSDLLDCTIVDVLDALEIQKPTQKDRGIIMDLLLPLTTGRVSRKIVNTRVQSVIQNS